MVATADTHDDVLMHNCAAALLLLHAAPPLPALAVARPIRKCVQQARAAKIIAKAAKAAKGRRMTHARCAPLAVFCMIAFGLH